jgi:hypothetical protein
LLFSAPGFLFEMKSFSFHTELDIGSKDYKYIETISNITQNETKILGNKLQNDGDQWWRKDYFRNLHQT